MWAELVDRALLEDDATHDITSELSIPENATGTYAIVAREGLVVCGLAAVEYAAGKNGVSLVCMLTDGAVARQGDMIVTLEGNVRQILAMERTVLNIMQHLSGIATFTGHYVEAVKGTKAVILDTRKTTPGLRYVEKYAVRTGGGQNHRMDLSEQVLLKDNHWGTMENLVEVVAQAKQRSGKPVIVECEHQHHINAALEAKADILLLDNMAILQLKEAVEYVAGKALTEASGGVALENVSAIAQTGVDRISIGALTHSARSVDIGLDGVNDT